jgi:tetratricopeptide (TPR) repeat protein
VTERLTKQQLKEDPLLTRTAEAADFASQHLRLIIGILVALAVTVTVVYFVRENAKQSEARAAAMLLEARTDFRRGNYDAAGSRLEDITRTMGGTQSGKAALLLYGDVRYAQERFQDAEQYFRRSLDAFKGDPMLASAARRGLGASLEALNRYEEAATIYEELAAGAPNRVLEAEMLLSAARNRLKAGQSQEAIDLYDRVSMNPDNIRAAQEARLRMAEIEATRAG